MIHRLASCIPVAAVALLLSSCFFDAGSATRRTEDEYKADADATGFQCRYSLGTGCIEASIPAAPEVTVNGKPFFDANDLAGQFEQVLAGSAPAVQADLLSKGGKIEFLTRIDNKAFAKGFQIFIKGQTAHAADALATGGFMVHRVPEGAYNMRVQKLVKYKIVQEQAPSEAEAEDPLFCATLHAEANVEVYAKERLQYLFDDYELFVADCPR
jgi:hypothetical protein